MSNATKKVRRRPSRCNQVTEDQIYKRLKQTFVEGFAWGMSDCNSRTIPLLRSAIKRLTENDAYWRGLSDIAVLQDHILVLKESQKLL